MNTLDHVQTGDVLAWKTDKKSMVSRILLNIVRFFTMSDFAHVAVAIRDGSDLYVLEAVIPKVKMTLMDSGEGIYHVPMELSPPKEVVDFLESLVGCDYSILDDLRAGVGLVSSKDDKWQCAEIVIEFCKRLGLIIDGPATPENVIAKLMGPHQKVLKVL